MTFVLTYVGEPRCPAALGEHDASAVICTPGLVKLVVDTAQSAADSNA
jgi:hypothetical protein